MSGQSLSSLSSFSRFKIQLRSAGIDSAPDTKIGGFIEKRSHRENFVEIGGNLAEIIDFHAISKIKWNKLAVRGINWLLDRLYQVTPDFSEPTTPKKTLK